MKSNMALWTAINAHKLDKPDSVTPFSQKLRQQQKWSTEFTAQAIEEYKRFIYLIAIAHHTLSPSPIVDEVWHLHLTYTKDYWEEFCKHTIGRSIHHTPSDGSHADASQLKQAYRLTQSLYYQEFGCLPPTRYWSPIKEKRKQIHLPNWRVFLCLAAISAFGLTSCKALPMTNSIEPYLLIFLSGLILINLLRALMGIRTVKQFFFMLYFWGFLVLIGISLGRHLDFKSIPFSDNVWSALLAFIFSLLIHAKKRSNGSASCGGSCGTGGTENYGDSGDSGGGDGCGSSCGGCGGD